jgi:hypothetical protein
VPDSLPALLALTVLFVTNSLFVQALFKLDIRFLPVGFLPDTDYAAL